MNRRGENESYMYVKQIFSVAFLKKTRRKDDFCNAMLISSILGMAHSVANHVQGHKKRPHTLFDLLYIYLLYTHTLFAL